MMHVQGTRVRVVGLCLVAALIAPGAMASDASTLRTELSGIPWIPAPREDGEKILYGEDDRLDVYQESDGERLQWAASVCALVNVANLTENGDGTYTASPDAYIQLGVPACEEEPFGTQPVVANCTGFMVGYDLIATAGHCVDSFSLDTTRFVFGFIMIDADTPVLIFDASQVYKGIEIVDWALGNGLDHAIVRTERYITAPGAEPLPLRREGEIEVGTPVGVIGHPSGLPMKVAFGENTYVRDNDPEKEYFTANMDAYGGNSGSPVFNDLTGEVEGILVRGPKPGFRLQGDCFVSITYPNDGAPLYIESSKPRQFEAFVPQAGLIETALGFRATPTNDLEGNPVIALTWENPAGDTFSQAVLVRSIGDYVEDPNEGYVLFSGREEEYLDTQIEAGAEYFYTLFVEMSFGGVQADFARATAGADAPRIWTESFGTDPVTGAESPLDLAFSQILFSPTGPPQGELGGDARGLTFDSYDVSYTRESDSGDPVTLPVPRFDAQGAAFNLTLGEDSGAWFTMNDRTFPFFGVHYSQFFIAANGYITFQSMETDDPLMNFPNPVGHFAVPRIAFLFADLAPAIGGDFWARALDDRIVVTYENVPEFGSPVYGVPYSLNTVQVELFNSGHIRMTYGAVSLTNAIVGLSDGDGVPLDPSQVFEDVAIAYDPIDYSDLPGEPGRLTFSPLASATAAQFVTGGETLEFTAETLVPPGLAGTPVLTGIWDRTGTAPFADNRDGTGTFSWTVPVSLSGTYMLRVKATLGSQQAYQDTWLFVDQALLRPEAFGLTLSTDTPFEDPSISRPVESVRSLMAGYEYRHPQFWDDTSVFAEGPTQILWFRNNQLVPSLVNTRLVPSSATRPGDQWFFRVLPVTNGLIAGEEVMSPVVTVVGYPQIRRITPAFGLITGGETVSIEGRMLAGPISVEFGGVEAAEMRAINANLIEAVTPLMSQVGKVPVTVTTAQGTGSLMNAFTFVYSAADIPKVDINQDGLVDAVDVQLVTNTVLQVEGAKSYDGDTNEDGAINALDIQTVVNAALRR